jgi:YVTN family beta-propeller protein
MEFRTLGPLEVSDNGRVLALGGGRQLALVALLLVHRNTVVPTERIVDELWEGSAPPTAAKIVRNSISLLRKELGERLVTRPPGYLLRIDQRELDADRLESAVEDGRPEALAEALALWRGAPLPEVAYYDFARAEIERLEELHLAAIEARIDDELAQGHHAKLVPELESLVRAHPLRDRLREQLMLALYRSGRQADALDTYQQARRTLDQELGLEPGRGLQELERRILNQDPTLDASAGGSQHRRRRRGGLLIAAGAAVLLAGAIAAGVIELTSGAGAESLTRVARNSVGVIDPKTNRIVAQIPVGPAPTRLALAGNSLWVANTEGRTISRLDAEKRIALREIPVPESPVGVAADAGGAWVVYPESRQSAAARGAFVDGRFNDVTKTVILNRAFQGSDAVAVGAGGAWFSDYGFVSRVDPATGKVRALIPVGIAATGLAVGAGAVWAIGALGIVRIDPSSNEIVSTIPIGHNVNAPGGPGPVELAVGEGSVWVANRLLGRNGYLPSGKRGSVSRIDLETNAVVATIRVGHEPSGIAVGGGAVWVVNGTDATVSRIDPHTNRVTATIRIGGRPQGIVVGNGAVWVSVS